MTRPPSLTPALVDQLITTRRHIHQHAEIAFHEVETASYIVERLRSLGLEPEVGVAGTTGLTAEIQGTRPGPVLMLRAETDALPIVEETPVPFASQNVGAMHACGHDAHVAILLTVIEMLLQVKDLAGTIKLVFQPAEEVCGGAKLMVDEGTMQGVDMVLALHLHGHMDVGTIGVCEDVATAGTSNFVFQATGRGGHGAFPEAAIDPIVTAGHVITALQTLIPREVASTQRAVLSVCTMSAGTAMNIIPERAVLTGTIRSVDDDVHELILRRAQEISEGIAGSFRCEGRFEPDLMAPSVHNDPYMSGIVRDAAAEVVGAEHVLRPPPVMAGDDLAYFFNQARGCYFFVGAAFTDGRPQTTHHISTWDIDERCLEIGAQVMLRASLEYLEETGDAAERTG